MYTCAVLRARCRQIQSVSIASGLLRVENPFIQFGFHQTDTPLIIFQISQKEPLGKPPPARSLPQSRPHPVNSAPDTARFLDLCSLRDRPICTVYLHAYLFFEEADAGVPWTPQKTCKGFDAETSLDASRLVVTVNTKKEQEPRQSFFSSPPSPRLPSLSCVVISSTRALRRRHTSEQVNDTVPHRPSRRPCDAFLETIQDNQLDVVVAVPTE